MDSVERLTHALLLNKLEILKEIVEKDNEKEENDEVIEDIKGMMLNEDVEKAERILKSVLYMILVHGDQAVRGLRMLWFQPNIANGIKTYLCFAANKCCVKTLTFLLTRQEMSTLNKEDILDVLRACKSSDCFEIVLSRARVNCNNAAFKIAIASGFKDQVKRLCSDITVKCSWEDLKQLYKRKDIELISLISEEHCKRKFGMIFPL